MEDKVGFGFRPTEEEVVGYFLLNQNKGNTELVDSINEVDICSVDPWDLRHLAKFKSRYPFWYFLSRRESKYATGNQQRRQTPTGFWKITGVPTDVVDQWGLFADPGEILGYKRVLGFHKGQSRSPRGGKSDWVIHEYHLTLLPQNQRNYVICRLEYKGKDKNMLTDYSIEPTPTFVANPTPGVGSVIHQSRQENSGSYHAFPGYDSSYQAQQYNELLNMQQSFQGNSGSYNIQSENDWANQSHQFGGNVNMQQPVQENSGSFNNIPEYVLGHQDWYSDLQRQAPYSASHAAELEMWINMSEADRDYSMDERPYMQQNYNDYQAKNPVSGYITDGSSGTDTDSVIGRDVWTSTDSVGSSNGPDLAPIDDRLSSTTTESFLSYEEPAPLKLQLQGNEKVINKDKEECECKTGQDSIKKTPTASTVYEKWIVLEEMSQRNAQWICLKNTIIGLLLLISIIGWIILFG